MNQNSEEKWIIWCIGKRLKLFADLLQNTYTNEDNIKHIIMPLQWTHWCKTG